MPHKTGNSRDRNTLLDEHVLESQVLGSTLVYGGMTHARELDWIVVDSWW